MQTVAIVLLPLFLLAGAAIQAALALRGVRREAAPEKLSGLLGVLAPLLAFGCAVSLFAQLVSGPADMTIAHSFGAWLDVGSGATAAQAALGHLHVDMGLRVDHLTAVMLLVITGVGTLIHLYSTAYMKGDPAYVRYFACLNLFTFFMTVLVMGANLLVLFIGWEGVGLCSYLLIGFWWKDEEKAQAGLKAFVVNRIGDAAFLIGGFLLWRAYGTLDFHELAVKLADPTAVKLVVLPEFDCFGLSLATVIGILLFIGATGKSAQVPLYVWLPDAMAGPTPVSALIHAATMVTAGVYMIARLSALYALSPTAQAVVMVVGAVTCIMAAGMALVQTDIKKVLAYSTVSQLGYMFIGVGSGAISAGVFHLVCHAFFKACLFLGAGSIIHAMHHEQDLRNMGGLRRLMPTTFKTMAIAAAAMAGIPPLSGFFSKDEILWQAWERGGIGRAVWAVGSLAALCTAFYAFRLIFLAFAGSRRQPPVVHGHAADHGHGHGHAHAIHESPRAMTIPLVVLAAGALVLGGLSIPHALGGNDVFASWLAPVTRDGEKIAAAIAAEAVAAAKAAAAKAAAAAAAETGGEASEHAIEGASHHADAGNLAVEWALLGVAALIGIIGVVTAHRFYVKRPELPAATVARFPALHRRLVALFGVDAFYIRWVVEPIKRFSDRVLFRGVDVGVIDRFVNGCGSVARRCAAAASSLQDGSIQTYLTWMVAGTLFLLFTLLT